MIYIVCALHCEAKPIIKKFKLSLDQTAIFPIFKCENIKLVVSGIGRQSTAAAMSYLFARDAEPTNSAWLNIGVAGKRDTQTGTLLNINKITEHLSGRCWYPARYAELAQHSSSLLTLDEPSIDYEPDVAYDMEASSFVDTALKFTSLELIQVLKVVSDNEVESIELLNKQKVNDLITQVIKNVSDTVTLLLETSETFSSIYFENQLYIDCMGKWHFSRYQQNVLKKLIDRWLVMDTEASLSKLIHCRDSKMVILEIQDIINDAPLVFGCNSND